MTSSPIVEGLLAIHKPTGITSAQVIRDVQRQFNPSVMFKAWLEEEAARLKDARKHHKKDRFRKGRRALEVKMGHGGTLDPLATGVLVLGVGAGTKRLSDFLSCTKSYDTVVLFGQATDTYDVVGKTVARKPYEHITREMVEEALNKFRGSIMQRPPIYSSLRVQGKHLYEYAREGKEVPVEIQERPVTVEHLELVEWFEGGLHPYNWPRDEASDEEKEVGEKVLHLETTSLKRGRDEDAAEQQPTKRIKDSTETIGVLNTASTTESGVTEDGAALAIDKAADEAADADGEPQAATSSTPGALPMATPQQQDPCPAPAARIIMTVTSGFYVRSLCHDLGEAVGSLGIMASLVRTRQGQFELGKNVFEYDDLAKGEDVWAPKVQELIVPVKE